ncbi:MAG: hypothetical protein HQM10_15300 [Candidatus Riflebacteria bacterium]|nr:hypothetical protein [Candidatus Riflebacteria bacterium]
MDIQKSDAEKLIERLSGYASGREEILRFLFSYRFWRQIRLFLTRSFIAAAVIIFVFIVFLLADRTFLSADFFRWLFSAGFYLSIVLLVLWIARLLIYPPDNSALAVELEKSDTSLCSALISSAEFAVTPTPAGTSRAMVKLSISDTARKLKVETMNSALSEFKLAMPISVFIISALIIGIWASYSPREVSIALERLLKPYSPIAPWSDFSMKVSPGNFLVAKGESVQILAVPSNIPDKEPVLTLFSPNDTTGHPTEMFFDDTSSQTRYVYTLNGLQESTDYQVSAPGYISERYSITVLPRPEIKSFFLTLVQPAYIATAPVELSEGTGDTTVLKGTRIIFRGNSTQPIASAVLSFDPPATITCDIDQKSFSAEFSPATSTTYSIMITGTSGFSNENPVKYQITLVQDATPTVEIVKPGVDLPFPKSRRLDLKVVAKDDFGIVSTVLYYSHESPRQLIPQNLKSDFSPKKDFEVEFPWLLDTLQVMPGTEVRYYVKVEDCMKPYPNVATTSVYKISMPSYYDVYNADDEKHGNVAKKIEEIMENQKYRRESLQKAYEQMRHEGKITEEMKKQLDEQIRSGEERQKEADEVLEQLNSLQKNMQDNPLSSPDALEKMQKVQELMSEVLDDEGKKLLKQLQDSVKNMEIDPKEMEKYEQAFKMEEYLKGLDRSIELLKQLKDEMKKNAIGEALQDLLKRQQEIASQTENIEKKAAENKTTPEDEDRLNNLKKQQEKLKDELEKLKKESEELANRKEKDGEQPDSTKEDMKNISDRLKNEDFKKTSDDIKKSLEEKNFQQARENQQKMLKFLESLAKDGEKVCQKCTGGSAPQLDLSRFIRRSLKVSHDQENLLFRLDGLPSQFMRGQMPAIEGRIEEISALQLLVKKQAENLEDALDTFIRTSFSISPDVLQPLKGVRGILSGTVKDLEDRQIDKSRMAQRDIISRFNQLAIELMKAQDQQNSSSSSSPQNALQQFKNLTQRQLSLYQNSKKESLSPADKQQMQRLRQQAMEQRMIRESLEKLMRESKKQMQTLGRMDDVMKDMEDLETKILDPNKRKEVEEKQKTIYERMLKAQKSIKNRDEESEERKAQKAAEKIQIVPDKPLDSAGSETRDLSKDYLREVREKFPKAYENEIRDYYKSLNLYGVDLK